MIANLLPIDAGLASAVLALPLKFFRTEKSIAILEGFGMTSLVEGHQQEDVAAAAHVADVPDGLRELHSKQRWDLLARVRLPTLQDAFATSYREHVPALSAPFER